MCEQGGYSKPPIGPNWKLVVNRPVLPSKSLHHRMKVTVKAEQVNREVTVSPQLEVSRESSGIALAELCPVIT